jgi:O-antigen ligase
LNIGNAKVSDILVKAFVVAVLLLSTNALLPLLLYGGSGGLESSAQGNDILTQLTWLTIYGVTFLLFIVRGRQCFHVATRDKLLLLLIGIAIVSILWSAEPSGTMRRSVALVGTTSFGVYLATRYGTGELLRLLAWALGISALLSLVFALALPSYGIFIDDRGAAWQGVYVHKNYLGRVMALGAVIFLLIALDARSYRWIAWAGCGLSVILLSLSNSFAAMASLLMVLLLSPLYRALRWNYFLAMPSFMVAIVAGGIVTTLFVTNTANVLTELGRDPTLTGRTDVWGAVVEAIRQRPWLGYGYGGFWLGWAGESARVALQAGFMPGHAHNGFLNLWLELGLLGVSVFVLAFSLTLLRAVAQARSTKTVEGFWPLVFLTFFVLYNLTESSLLGHNDIFWILYVAVALSTFTKDTKTGAAPRAGTNPGRHVGAKTIRT